MSGFVLGPGDGAVYDLHGASVVIKASGGDTLGQLAVMESVYPPGLSVHPYVHAGEDEMFYLLSGELVGYCENENWTATAGTFVFVPRDQVHGFTVTGDAPARALVITGRHLRLRDRELRGRQLVACRGGLPQRDDHPVPLRKQA